MIWGREVAEEQLIAFTDLFRTLPTFCSCPISELVQITVSFFLKVLLAPSIVLIFTEGIQISDGIV